ncbi:MAG: LuxR family transcriptional regulator [Rhodococcus sp.]|uniref:helix-turn-helix transcriptional regulator n=1 Tax=Rhodococcus TaxID=1827 RepID=UPI0016BB38D2|nr:MULTISPECIES: helix-turn-helix transcriptional regulator [Rhodococcus]NLV79837.1 LuxR family transcriptional regulator [Rhodococcus sp. (in: high G+C Gram-positive bacteria)]
MDVTDVLGRARDAYDGSQWARSLECFRACDRIVPLCADDLDRAGQAAYLVGAGSVCAELLERAADAHLAAARPERAAESAFRLSYILGSAFGEPARAAGWLTRARRMLDDAGIDGPVGALLTVPPAIGTLLGGDPAAALPVFERAHAVGVATGHVDLTVLSGVGLGQSRLLLGDVHGGLVVFDDILVSVAGPAVSPLAAGIAYCAVIITCHETFQLGRAAEWTRALGRWCDDRPDLVPFRGQCMVHRAELLQLHGQWTEAMARIRDACTHMSGPRHDPAVGLALYELAELHRLRGEYTAADASYRRSARAGHDTEPGLALLRLAQGDVDTALGCIDRALAEAGPLYRLRLLDAAVQIRLAAGDLDGARACADELTSAAAHAEAPALHAMAAYATGIVLLAAGDAAAALEQLRAAWRWWQQLDAPYRCALVRAAQGRCCSALGDHETAHLEFEAAADTFRALHAMPELDRVRSALPPQATAESLTRREVEVLRVVAAGRTNREIAAELFLSEKTVARHLSNIFGKLGVSSRSGATAYAFEHHLI